MRQDEISRELRDLAFDFFYWFSRFEFALKEAPYLEDDKVGARAMPGWEKFFADWQGRYTLTPASQKLIDAKPHRQVVGPNGLDFAEVRFDDKPSDLVKVIRLEDGPQQPVPRWQAWQRLLGRSRSNAHADPDRQSRARRYCAADRSRRGLQPVLLTRHALRHADPTTTMALEKLSGQAGRASASVT